MKKHFSVDVMLGWVSSFGSMVYPVNQIDSSLAQQIQDHCWMIEKTSKQI